MQEVIDWAARQASPSDGSSTVPDWTVPDWTVPDWRKLVAPLAVLHDELRTTVDAAVAAGIAVEAPLEQRKQKIRTFDFEAQRGSRVLERALEVVGLPTLAAAVRPHLEGTGRVGRPSARPPADQHPDLVTQVEQAGLLPEPEPADGDDRQAEPATTAPSSRRRIILGVPQRKLKAVADRAEVTQLDSVEATPPVNRVRPRRTRRRHRVAFSRSVATVARPRIFRRSRLRLESAVGETRAAPWADEALDGWHRRGNAEI